MSDGFIDIARDDRRSEKYIHYVNTLIGYFESSSEESLTELRKSAIDVDSVRGGYLTGRTSLSTGLDLMLKKLQGGDKTAWARTLSEVRAASMGHYERLQALSPFKDSLLVFVGYGIDFCRGIDMDGLEKEIHRRIEREGYPTFDADTYLLSLEISTKKLLSDSEVTWVDSGRFDVPGPRKIDPSKEGEKNGE